MELDPYPRTFLLKHQAPRGGRGGNLKIVNLPVVQTTPPLEPSITRTIRDFFMPGQNQTPPNVLRRIDVLVVKPLTQHWWGRNNANSFRTKTMSITVESKGARRTQHTIMTPKERQELAEFLYPDNIRLDRYNGTLTNISALPIEVVFGYSVWGRMICLPRECMYVPVNPTHDAHAAPGQVTRGVPRKVVDMFFLTNQAAQPNATKVMIMNRKEILELKARKKTPVRISQTVKNAIFQPHTQFHNRRQ
jgi:hypothetical protein